MARSTDRGPDRELSKRDRPARKKPRRPPKTGHRLALGEQIEDPNEYGVRVSPRSPVLDSARWTPSGGSGLDQAALLCLLQQRTVRADNAGHCE